MMVLLLMTLVLCTKVTISPISDRLIAFSYTRKTPTTSVFNFVSKSRINQTLRTCMIPLIVPLKNGSHRLYFCGKLMCLTDVGLDVCDTPAENSEFRLKVHKDMFLIGKLGFCLHYTEGNLFFRDCDVRSKHQLFYIDRVQVPQGDDEDITAFSREEGRGSKMIQADSAFRELSNIRTNEYIRDLYDNLVKYELEFSNEKTNVDNESDH